MLKEIGAEPTNTSANKAAKVIVGVLEQYAGKGKQHKAEGRAKQTVGQLTYFSELDNLDFPKDMKIHFIEMVVYPAYEFGYEKAS
ncbi:MAG: hypothetical protein FWE04_01615 [Oscillospiraceae bacterium]|nr:hypothetical protein [Oscillospiraceae bacterium]